VGSGVGEEEEPESDERRIVGEAESGKSVGTAGTGTEVEKGTFVSKITGAKVA
jgi:hypothetical protein